MAISLFTYDYTDVPSLWGSTFAFYGTGHCSGEPLWQLPERLTTVKERHPPAVDYVRSTLKLLHMVEFYLLVEFIEVVVAVVYAIYLTAIFYLPNRAFYLAVSTLTHTEFVETVGQVLQYAALELLSLAMLCIILDRLLGFSTLRMLAFTLRKHAVLAQSQLTLWVFMSTQFSLEHFGCDYTFQFAWLRRPVEQNAPSGDSSSAT